MHLVEGVGLLAGKRSEFISAPTVHQLLLHSNSPAPSLRGLPSDPGSGRGGLFTRTASWDSERPTGPGAPRRLAPMCVTSTTSRATRLKVRLGLRPLGLPESRAGPTSLRPGPGPRLCHRHQDGRAGAGGSTPGQFRRVAGSAGAPRVMVCVPPPGDFSASVFRTRPWLGPWRDVRTRIRVQLSQIASVLTRSELRLGPSALAT